MENQKLQEENQTYRQKFGAERALKDKDLHLVFMFATPLVIRNHNDQLKLSFKEKFRPQPLLQFKKEFKEIKDCLKETHQHIKVRSLQGTIENFTKILGQQPLALHFTGHGTESKDPVSGKITNTLMLEHTYGEAENVTEE